VIRACGHRTALPGGFYKKNARGGSASAASLTLDEGDWMWTTAENKKALDNQGLLNSGGERGSLAKK
jgi:hypothetical protein